MKYGMLTVENESIGVNRFNQKLWLCRCNCGTPTIVIASAVIHGHTQSCGCLKIGSRRTHGQRVAANGRRSKSYACWSNLKNRCDSPANPAWHNYGGRGIKYDPRWAKFENFLQDMGEPPVGLSLDRIDNDGPYTKANCRWANRDTQRRNNRQIVWCDIDGERLILTDAVRKYGKVPYATAVCRISYGWKPEQAVLTPYTRKFSHVPEGGTRYELNGASKTLAEWAIETGIKRLTLFQRIKRGVPLELALTVKGFLDMRKYGRPRKPC